MNDFAISSSVVATLIAASECDHLLFFLGGHREELASDTSNIIQKLLRHAMAFEVEEAGLSACFVDLGSYCSFLFDGALRVQKRTKVDHRELCHVNQSCASLQTVSQHWYERPCILCRLMLPSAEWSVRMLLDGLVGCSCCMHSAIGLLLDLAYLQSAMLRVCTCFRIAALLIMDDRDRCRVGEEELGRLAFR